MESLGPETRVSTRHTPGAAPTGEAPCFVLLPTSEFEKLPRIEKDCRMLFGRSLQRGQQSIQSGLWREFCRL